MAEIFARLLGAVVVVASIAVLLFIPIYVLKAILDSGEALAAVLPTLLWVGLIIWLAVRYDTGIRSLFASVKKRIDEGANFEFSWFKLVSAVHPISEEERQKRRQDEMKDTAGEEADQEGPGSNPHPQPPPSSTTGPAPSPSTGPAPNPSPGPTPGSLSWAARTPPSGLRYRSLEAHELAESWLTRTYGAALKPNVRVGAYEVDAAILPSPTGKIAAGIVEIKYISNTQQLIRAVDAIVALREKFLTPIASARVDYLEAVFVVENAELSRKATERLGRLSEQWKNTPVVLVGKVELFDDLKMAAS